MIYLDNNATTCLAPEVLEAMLPWLGDHYGNPSGGYRFGREARKAVDRSREQVAALIGAQPGEIVFTSGGTESNNTAIRSALALRPDCRTLVSSTVEHSAVEEVLKYHQSRGYEVILNPVDSTGRLDLGAWRESLAKGSVAIASLILANNETGVLSPFAEAAAIAAEHGVYFHTDAVQAVGKIPIDVSTLPVHALSLSAHKFHGPKGIGALYLNRHTRFEPQTLGGGQEQERRSGTENVPGIIGFGVAAELAALHLAEAGRIAALRDHFESAVIESLPDAVVNGEPANRLPNTSNLYFPGVDGEGLLILLDEAGVSCSPGSACSTGAVQPSRIVRAMGHSAARARSSVRFSLSRFTSAEEIASAAVSVVKAVGKLRVVMPSGGGRVVGPSPSR
ncbi:MAG: aminotransferase class V-fold PLP-dependent enzyme [Verrucomicrobiales bacterium]|nr:aminotransferase class V-fold PLP-dependent enzyme [Verrucomicrobiales bacterium]MDP4790693.1 aminotransferase class V-fold PLP-dependent enzyme [Verrucomicrobiales bacterium]MDP5005485.1 aminotransferase class V-fold PLP-dependent enzyme [Verrucomicrobiales bacterium]